jgi:hypothetical protein
VPPSHIAGEGALYLHDKPVNVNSLTNEIRRCFPGFSRTLFGPKKDTPGFAGLGRVAVPKVPIWETADRICGKRLTEAI